MIRIFSFSVFVVAALIVFAHTSSAAETALPGTANPNLLERQLEQPPLPKATGEPSGIPSPEAIAPPPGAEKIHFALKDVVIEGATVYQPDDFRPLYEKQIGQEISVKDVYEIAQAITAQYAADGWVLSQAVVPPQKIGKDGIVHIKVVEGFVDRVIIDDAITKSRNLLEAYGDKISAERPLNIRTLERYLLLANDLPGVNVSGVLKPSVTVPGAADLVFSGGNKDVDATAELNDRGSRYVGPWQSTVTGNLNSVLGRSDRTGLLFTTTPFSLEELKYTQLSHEEELDDEGTKLTASFGYIGSHPGNTLAAADIGTRSYEYIVALTHPLIRSRPENLNVNLKFDWLDTDTDQDETVPLYQDHLRVLRAGASYDWIDTLLFSPAVSLASLEISQGLDGLGASAAGSTLLSRSGGYADFIKGNFDASRTQPVYDRFSLALGMSGQIANAPLLSSEQFAFGGVNFGRGYDPAALTGDDGVAGKAELQYAGPEIPHIQAWQAYTFYDVGKVWQISPIPGSAGESAMSTGLGIRASITDWASINAELAKPLTKSVAAGGTAGGDFRGFIDLIVRY